MKPFRWIPSRISRPVDRPKDAAAPTSVFCPHCGTDGCVIDFQLVRCSNSECRYFDPAAADLIDQATIERNAMREWVRRWGGGNAAAP